MQEPKLHIGSDFESLKMDQLADSSVPPWESTATQTAYAETGRQVLSIAAEVLEHRGFNEVFMPSHLCESMIQPFLSRGWAVDAIPLTRDLRIDTANQPLPFRSHSVVVLAAYFGHIPSPAHIELAHAARSVGAFVIEDETHRVFTPGADWAHLRFASLRKILPVADGAYAQGHVEILSRINQLPASDSRRWTAMDMKTGKLNTEGFGGYREVMDAENGRLEQPGRLRHVTDRTIQELKRLPYEVLASTRLKNSATLRLALHRAGVRTVNIDERGVPSYVVIVIEKPREMQRRLAAQGVYCPIHWPATGAAPSGEAWRNDLLSIPVDHRYDADDMERVAQLIQSEAE